jgi:hypothetical protein
MQLAKLYQYYKISPKQLEDILGKHYIKVQLKLVKTVPATWLTILNEELGIPQPEVEDPLGMAAEEVKPGENQDPVNTRSINLESALRCFFEEAAVRRHFRLGPKGARLTMAE